MKIVKSNEGTMLNVLGDNQVIKLSGKDTNGQFTLICQDNSPGTQIPKHLHANEDEIFILTEGEVIFEIDDQIVNLKSGDMIFLPRNIAHAFKVIGDKNAKVILNIFPSGIENMFEELSLLPTGPPDKVKITEIGYKYGVSYV